MTGPLLVLTLREEADRKRRELLAARLAFGLGLTATALRFGSPSQFKKEKRCR